MIYQYLIPQSVKHIHKLSIIQKKNNGNKKNISNKNKRSYRDVKTPKICEQGQEINVGPKIKQMVYIITYNLT